jgi:hypothetical protein
VEVADGEEEVGDLVGFSNEGFARSTRLLASAHPRPLQVPHAMGVKLGEAAVDAAGPPAPVSQAVRISAMHGTTNAPFTAPTVKRPDERNLSPRC